MTEYQVRTYYFKPGKLAEFLPVWHQRVVPLREEFGFKVLYGWANAEESEFIWLLSYDGEDGYAAREKEHYSSPGWKAIADVCDFDQLIDRIETHILHSIPVHK